MTRRTLLGTLANTTAAKMRELPINNFYNSNFRIMPDGCVPHTMSVWEVKPLTEVKHRWDLFKLISTVPTPDAYAPTGTFGCSVGAS